MRQREGANILPAKWYIFFCREIPPPPERGGEEAASGAECQSTLPTAQCNLATKGAFAPQPTEGND